MTGWLLLAVGGWLLVGGSSRYRLGSRQWRPRLPVRGRGDGRSEAVVELLAGLRDELNSGAALHSAFERASAAAAVPVVPAAVAVCRMGGNVPEALRADAEGSQLVVSLAALWQISEGSGAAMAAALDRLVDGAREAARLRRAIDSELAGPRATVRVLAFLPLIGLGMGFLMGANPLAFLLGSPIGWGCIAAAAALEVAGVLWMRTLVRGIEKHL